MNEEIQKQLEDIFTREHFSEEDREYWKAYIAAMPRQMVGHVVMFLDLFPDRAHWLRSLHERKAEVLRTGDKTKWEGIINEEINYINSLTAR